MTPKKHENVSQFMERQDRSLPDGLLTASQIASAGKSYLNGSPIFLLSTLGKNKNLNPVCSTGRGGPTK